jgi:hypothetical protein
MRLKPIPPTVRKDDGPIGGTIKTHPAFGLLSFHRVSGGDENLFGSEIKHGQFINMTLVPGEELRSLSRDWYLGKSRPLVKVRMSAAQFAELITSMNVGSGVPVTIDYVADEMGYRPGIADTDTFHETLQSELKKEVQDAFADTEKLLKTLEETLAKSGLSKVKQKELTDIANRIQSSVKSSMPYILEQYQEDAEKIGAKAKAEVEAWTMHAVMKAGLESLLNQKSAPQQLESGQEGKAE